MARFKLDRVPSPARAFWEPFNLYKVPSSLMRELKCDQHRLRNRSGMWIRAWICRSRIYFISAAPSRETTTRIPLMETAGARSREILRYRRDPQDAIPKQPCSCPSCYFTIRSISPTLRSGLSPVAACLANRHPRHFPSMAPRAHAPSPRSAPPYGRETANRGLLPGICGRSAAPFPC